MLRRVIAALLTAFLLQVVSWEVAAQRVDALKLPVVLQADELIHDKTEGIVTATGNVKAAQGRRILHAARVVYNQRINTVIATGNVILLEPDGEVVFADFMELTDEMKNGLIRKIRIILSDNSRFAANGALRSNGNRTEMSKAVFSPCPLCLEKPEESPLWQIKAIRVVHDQRRRQITYTDAFLEIFGIPIAYTPYFSHPDPTVKRRGGFLTPSFGSNSRLGLIIKTPYFFNLAPNRDATFLPIFTSKEGVVLGGEYRHRVESGRFSLSGSITRPRKRGSSGKLVGGRKTRGHIKGAGAFTIDDTWKWGFNFERSTDDTYLRRYGFNSKDMLTSNVFVKGVRGRNYAAINAYAFQGLNAQDKAGNTPYIAPIMDFNFIGDADRFGRRYTLDVNFMELFKTSGMTSTRLSLKGGWRRPFMGQLGDLYTVTAGLRGDAYWVKDVRDPRRPKRGRMSGLTGRIIPQLSVDWRLPLIRRSGGLYQIIEPMAKLIISPYGGNPGEIPNEDSQSFEFDDTNLFDSNRFSGLDRVEGGPRLSYGIRASAYGASGAGATAFIGQSFRTKAGGIFKAGSGLENKRSDFVGRIVIRPSKLIDLTYRFRLDNDTFALRHTTIDLTAGPDWLQTSLGFLFINKGSADLSTLGRRKELNLSMRLALGPEWSFSAFNRRNLEKNKNINMGASLTYQNECILFTTQLQRNFIRDRDLVPSTSISFTIKFKNLG